MANQNDSLPPSRATTAGELRAGGPAELERVRPEPQRPPPHPGIQVRPGEEPRLVSLLPELFPGFRTQFSQLEITQKESASRLNALTLKNQQLMRSFVETPTIENVGILTQAALLTLPQAGMTALEQEVQKRRLVEEQNGLLEQMALEQDNLQHESWRLDLMMGLSTLLAGGLVNTAEDVFREVGFEGLNEEDQAFTRELLANLQPSEEQQLALTERMTVKAGSLTGFLDIDSDESTVEEILAQLSEASLFRLPEGETTESIRSYLLKGALNEDDVSEIMLDARSQSLDMAKRMRDKNTYFASLRSDKNKAISGEVVSAIHRAKISRALSQPAIGFFYPLELWMGKVNHPLSGILLVAMEGAVSGFSRREMGFKRRVQSLRNEGGENWWFAYGRAFEETDMNWAARFAIEVIADPTTYLGFGLVGKVISLGGGRVARLGLAVSKVEKAYLNATEMPWRVLRDAWVDHMPRTAWQRGRTQGTGAAGALAREVASHYGKPIGDVTPGETKLFIELVVEKAINEPLNPAAHNQLGKMLLGRKAISAEQVEDLYKTMNVSGGDASPARLELINTILEFTDGQGVMKFLMPEQATDLLLRVMAISDSAENKAFIFAWLGRTREGAKAAALGLADRTSIKEILKGTVDKIADDYVAADQTIIGNNRALGGLNAAMLDFLSRGPLTKAMLTIDRTVTQPFARAYLLFGFYAPFNVLENAAKTALAGGNPFWTTNPSRRVGSVFKGVEDLAPLDIMFEEKFFMQTEFPDVSASKFTNPWSSAQARLEADKDMRAFIEKMLAPRWLKSISGFNWGADIGGAQRQQYWISMFRKEMALREPEIIDSITRLVDEETIGFDKLLGKDTAEAYRQEMNDRLLTGDFDFFKNITDQFTPGKLHAHEVKKAFEDYPEIGPHIVDFVVKKAETGELWAAGPSGVTKLFREKIEPVVYEQFWHSPELFNHRYKEFVEGMIEWVPATQSELNFKMNAIDQSVDLWGETFHTVIAAAVRYSETAPGLKAPAARAKYFDDFFKQRVQPHMEEGSRLLRELIEDTKKKMGAVTDFEPKGREAYERLIDLYAMKVSMTKKARTEAEMVRKTWQNPTGAQYVEPRKRTNQWWDSFRAEQSKPWDDLEDDFLKNSGDVAKEKASITGMATPQLVDATKVPLTVKNIAELFGISPVEMRRHMYLPEIMALRGQKSFVSMIRSRAEIASGGPEQSDAMGYTVEAITKVYDNLMFALKKETRNIGEDVAPVFKQLESAMKDVIFKGMRRGTLMNEEVATAVQSRVTNIAIEIERGSRGAGDRARSKAIRELFEPDRTVITRPDAEVWPKVEVPAVRKNPKPSETVYHGSQRVFEKFDAGRSNPDALYGPGAYFTEDPTVASGYARTRRAEEAVPNVTPVKLTIKKSFDIDDSADKTIVDDILKDLDAEDNLTRDAAEDFIAAGEVHSNLVFPDGIKTNDDLYQFLVGAYGGKAEVADALASSGFNAITHVGGKSTGTAPHRVWIVIGDEMGTDDLSQFIQTAVGKAATPRQPTPKLGYLPVKEVEPADIESLSTGMSLMDYFKKKYPEEPSITGIGVGEAVYSTIEESLPSDIRAILSRLRQGTTHPSIVNENQAKQKLFLEESRRLRADLGARIMAGDFPAYKEALEASLRDVFPEGKIRIFRTSTQAGRFREGLFTDVTTNPQQAQSYAQYFGPGEPRWVKGTKIQEFEVPIENVIAIGNLAEDGLVVLPAKARPEAVTTVIPSKWQAQRRSVMEEIRQKFVQDFPDHTQSTAVSSLMKTIYPFWGYEAHRWAYWLPREFARHPGSYAAVGKYLDNTDQGYVTVPGTDLDINPLRGTILMGGMRRLFQRDYPEFYDSFGGLSETVDAFSRYGFFPGAPYGIVMAMFGAKFAPHPQFGEVAPASLRSVVDVLTALFPQQMQPIRDVVFHDRFRDFQIANAVSTYSDRNGMEMLEKTLGGGVLTDEEQKIWNSAGGRVARLGILMEQTALFRFRPEEKTKVFRAAADVYEKYLGIPASVFIDMGKIGVRAEDLLGPMPPTVQRQLGAIEGWGKYTGASIALQPSELGRVQVTIREFWDAVSNVKQDHKDKLLEIEGRMKMENPQATMKDWMYAFKTQNKDLIAFIKNLSTTGLNYKDPDNPGESLIPMSLSDRQDFAEKYGLDLMQFHPVEEMRDLYFQNELKEVFDEDLNAWVPDWDSFFLYRSMVEQGAGPEAVAELQELNAEGDSPIATALFEANRTLFRPYRATFDAVLKLYSESEQVAIKKHRIETIPEERYKLEAMTTTVDGEQRQLMATFAAQLRQFRTNLRETDPELDAHLVLFRPDIATSFKTKTAETRFYQLRRELGLPST
jgi:hypothetical protein